jgi:hypothetical protein
LPQEVCDSLSKSSARCNLGLTWDQTNFFASKSLASGPESDSEGKTEESKGVSASCGLGPRRTWNTVAMEQSL